MALAKKKRGRSRAPGRPETSEPKLDKQAAAVKKWIEAQPGAVAVPYPARKGSPPVSIMYKVANRIFAILALRGEVSVILKCDPHLAAMLRKQYTAVGHRSHLDRRLWINVTLDADVPGKEIERWVSMSYDLVCSKLTAKERSGLR